MVKKETLEQAPITPPVPGTESHPVFEQSVQSRYLDCFGRELPNPTPLQPAVGHKKHKTIAETVREAIRQASLEAAQHGYDSEEDANDFDIDEDDDPHSPWENDFDMDPALEAMLALQSAPPVAPTAPPVSAPATPTAAPPVQPSAPVQPSVK